MEELDKISKITCVMQGNIFNSAYVLKHNYKLINGTLKSIEIW